MSASLRDVKPQGLDRKKQKKSKNRRAAAAIGLSAVSPFEPYCAGQKMAEG
jgi:hypothetical protein